MTWFVQQLPTILSLAGALFFVAAMAIALVRSL